MNYRVAVFCIFERSPEFEKACSKLHDFVWGKSGSDISKDDFKLLETTLKAIFEEFALSSR
jgi:hypothetical protein